MIESLLKLVKKKNHKMKKTTLFVYFDYDGREILYFL